MYQETVTKIHEYEACSFQQNKQRNPQFWWIRELQESVEEQKLLYHQLLSTGGAEDRKQFVRITKSIKKW